MPLASGTTNDENGLRRGGAFRVAGNHAYFPSNDNMLSM